MQKRLLFLLPLCTFFFGIYSCSKPFAISDHEKEWLAQNDSISIALFPYYPPYQFINEQNEVDGVFIEYLELIEQKINYKFKRKRYKDWETLLQDFKENKIEVTLEIQETEERKSQIEFYPPLFKSQHTIVTRKDAQFGNSIKNLHNKVILLPQGYAITENLNQEYPNYNFVTYGNELTCLEKLNSGAYDAFIGPKAIANYYIRSKNLDNLKINTDIHLSYTPGLAINKSNVILNRIISRTIESITKEQKKAILHNWFYTNVTPIYRTSKFWIVISLLTLLSIIIGISINAYLKFKIKERTKELLIAKDIAEESNRLKTNFIKNIPQEIRTPMNGIISLSEYLDDEEISVEDRQKFTKMIIGSSKGLLSIIDDILEISQLQTKRFSIRLVETNLVDVFKTLISRYEIKAEERNTKIYLENNLSDDQNFILMDRTKLNKVLNAITDNAVKYTTNGFIHIKYMVKGDLLFITIQDTGEGINDKTQKKIIQSLANTEENLNVKYNGLGLGLTIAKKNADFIGGQIMVTSEKNKGTTYIIKVPYNPISKNIKGETNDLIKNSKTEKSIILIAEDVETNFFFLKTILSKMKDYDFVIYRATNGQEAITICEENENIDLVLMDIKMPIMNGYDATKYIKQMRPNLPIIAQTAYSIEEDVLKALEAGCDDFISKPVDQKVLTPIVRKYISVFKKRNKTTNPK